MIDQLISLDQELFLAVNNGMSSAFLDWLLPILRNPYTWAPLYLFVIVFCIINYKKVGVFMVVALLVNFAISDMVSSTVIKKSVQRIRPCNDVELKDDVILRVRCGSGYSFTSSHATNHFAMAVLLIGLFYRRWKPILGVGLLWAAAISFSQVYVGVHYPGDVLAGALVGAAIGLFTTFIFNLLKNKFKWAQ